MSMGMSSLIISNWIDEFANHKVNDSFLDLDSFGQNIADNNIASDLNKINQDVMRYEALNKWYATTSMVISTAMIAPLGMGEGMAAGLGVLGKSASKPFATLRGRVELQRAIIESFSEFMGPSGLLTGPGGATTYAYIQQIGIKHSFITVSKTLKHANKINNYLRTLLK